MLSASTSMPCSSIARSRSDTCVTMLSSGRVGGAGAPSVIPTRAIASATAQCACTSTVLTRRPLTATSRRRVWPRTGAAARRSQPTNARPASAPVVVPRNSLRVVMVGPPFRRGRVSCRIMGRFLWPLAVVAALAIGWVAAGVAGKTSAARETEQLKQQVSTLQARLHAREEITGARAGRRAAGHGRRRRRGADESAQRRQRQRRAARGGAAPGHAASAAIAAAAEGHRREGQRRAPAPRRGRRAAPAADARVAARAGEHPGQRRRRSLRPPERRVRPGRVGPDGRRHRVGADLPGIERRRARARDGVPRARLAERRALAPVHAPGRGVGGRAVVSAARDPVPDRAGRSAIRGDAAGPHAVSHRAGVDSRRRRAGVPDPRRQVIVSADVVVVGSGAFAASAAYHLVRRGLRVAVLERAPLASQTSPRAAGLTSQVRATPALTTLARRAVTKLAAFSDETGQPLRFTQSGALKIARTERDAEQLALEVTRGVAAGIPIDFVSVAEARQRLPILGERGIVAVTWSPTDCNVEPSELPLGYCRAAEKLGAVLLPQTPATGFDLDARGVEGVRTPRGTIATRAVVDAAGAWARLVAAGLGAPLPVVPTRHQLLITAPIPGVGPEFPIARVIDVNGYVRHERGGLRLRGYEPEPGEGDR